MIFIKIIGLSVCMGASAAYKWRKKDLKSAANGRYFRNSPVKIWEQKKGTVTRDGTGKIISS